MENQGYNRGYFLYLFAIFLNNLFVSYIFQSMIVYIFGINLFTGFILTIMLSFLINTSLPTKDSYPFFRHLLIFGSLSIVNIYSFPYIMDKLNSFFHPNVMWSLMILLGFILGVISSFGRIGNGIYSLRIETYANLILLVFIVLSFILFGWKGGLVYLVFKILLMTFEKIIANAVIHMIVRKNDDEEINA